MASNEPIPLLPSNPKALDAAERSQLIGYYEHCASMENEWLYRQIVDNNRIDILAITVLGYEVKPFHLSMMRFQFLHPDSLQLAYRGAGKCLEPGTPVMCSDGSVIPAEEVKVGDQLMGPDSKPRTVLSLSQGRGKLYRVVPTKGDSWVCNDAHILTLKGRGFYANQIRDVRIEDVIEQGKRYSRGTSDIPWKLFRTPIEFQEQETPIDPYLLGLWLGDGTFGEAAISNPEPEILEWLHKWAAANGYGVTVLAQRGCDRITFTRGGNANPLRRYLRSFSTKIIPDEYMRNSRSHRFALLAGLLDTDGHYRKYFEIVQKGKTLAKQIVYLARSLGLAAYLKEKKGTIKSIGFEGIYYRVSISGELNEIPCIVERKKPLPRKIAKDALVTGFEIEDAGVGEYRGFELSGDGRFLLGDFTVTHNSTTCTITKIIHYLCKNRNLRILIASKTSSNAEGFLKEIKAHLEGTQKLIDVFGAFYDPKKVAKWDNKEIEVVGRTIKAKEASVTCVGVDGTIVSKHVDVIMSDDLVDEENARTPYMRERTQKWYYQTLDPILEPPDEKVPHRGEHHRLGTRYHFADLWGHLIENELEDHHQIIKALDDKERSPWPEKHTPEWFKQKKAKAGLIIFNAQFQNDTEAMKGEIFQFDDCQQVNDSEVPPFGELQIFMGVDLAISQKEKSDLFAIVVGGFDKIDNCYIIDYYEGHLRFNAQTKMIKKYYKKYDPIRAGIEINAYQEAQYQNLKDDDRDIRLTPINTSKDKIVRAWKLSPRFEDKRMFFRKGLGRLIDALVLFPNFRYKDGFDALDFMVQAKLKKKRRRPPRKEPGVI